MAYDERRKAATIKYLATLKEVRFRVKPETYSEYQAAAAAAGQSVSAYIMQAVRERMERGSG